MAGKPSKRSRRYNLRRIKATYPYTVPEIARLLDVHKNAVLRWMKRGLRADGPPRQRLIRGDELIRFLSEHQMARRRKCKLTEFYCFRCRVQREVLPGSATVDLDGLARLRVKAKCKVCATTVNKMQGLEALARICEAFDIGQLDQRHLRERAGASVNGAQADVWSNVQNPLKISSK
jgi:hypothetical protein